MKLNVMFIARYREAQGLDGEAVEGDFSSIEQDDKARNVSIGSTCPRR